MPTYVYETIPTTSGEQPEQFEIEQRMSAAALTTHPDTGVPVRRVVSGGAGFLSDRPVAGAQGGGAAGGGETNRTTGGHVHGPNCNH